MPTYGEIAEILTAMTAIGAFLLSWWNNQKLNHVRVAQEQQHQATNSRLDQLVAVTGLKERAEGMAEGLQQGRTEPR